MILLCIIMVGCVTTGNYKSNKTTYYNQKGETTGYSLETEKRVDYYNQKGESVGYSLKQ